MAEQASALHKIMLNATINMSWEGSRPDFVKNYKIFWNAYNNFTSDLIEELDDARSRFHRNAALSSKIKQIWNINASIIQAHSSNDDFLLEFPTAEIDISELNITERESLISVYNTVKQKSSIQVDNAANTNRAQITPEDAASEILIIIQRGFLSERDTTVNSSGLSRVVRRFNKSRNLLTEPEIRQINAIITEAGLVTENENRVSVGNVSNLFMIDYPVSLAYLFRRTEMTKADVMIFLRAIASFSFSNHVGRSDQTAFWRKYVGITKNLRDFIHETSMTLWDDPYKMTFKRLSNAVSVLTPTCSEVGITMAPECALKLQTVSQICKYSTANNMVKPNVGESSIAEHLVHQILVQGAKSDLGYNKFFIKGSAAHKVMFKFNTERTATQFPPFDLAKLRSRITRINAFGDSTPEFQVSTPPISARESVASLIIERKITNQDLSPADEREKITFSPGIFDKSKEEMWISESLT